MSKNTEYKDKFYVAMLDESDADIFKEKLEGLLNDGYRIQSSSCSNTDEWYEYERIYLAMLTKSVLAWEQQLNDH